MNKDDTSDKLLEESKEISNKLDMLQEDIVFTGKLVHEIGIKIDKQVNNKTNGIIDIDKDEISSLRNTCILYVGRLRLMSREMKKLNDIHEDLRKRANAYYGKEIVPAWNIELMESIDWDKILNSGDDDDNEGEEWKQ